MNCLQSECSFGPISCQQREEHINSQVYLDWVKSAAAAATSLDEVQREVKGFWEFLGLAQSCISSCARFFWLQLLAQVSEDLEKRLHFFFCCVSWLISSLQSFPRTHASSGSYLTTRPWRNILMIYVRIKPGPRARRSTSRWWWRTRTCWPLHRKQTQWKKVGRCSGGFSTQPQLLKTVLFSVRSWTKRVLRMENSSAGRHHVCVPAGQSELGLLHVCLEGRPHPLQPSEGCCSVK